MSDLVRELLEAEAKVARLRQKVAAASCAEVGHRWESVGGTNCGCHNDASCSVPVNECAICGASDYGDNDEAWDVRNACPDRHPEPSP